MIQQQPIIDLFHMCRLVYEFQLLKEKYFKIITNFLVTTSSIRAVEK